ncbi:MAG: hypothetical protein SO071_03780 [Prevotella sp.]|nr:hypothetical protein [Prevotella sp.]
MRYCSTSRLVLQYQIAYTKRILMDDSIERTMQSRLAKQKNLS